tara:strand:+ start:11560 stop:12183 length:624 start_codon:yes stop_codon:yes gene_type:complete
MKDTSSSNLKAKAEADLDAGRRELLAELKRHSASGLHSIDPALLARLTPDQRAELFSGHERRAQHAPQQEMPPAARRKTGQRSLIRRGWNAVPLLVRSQVVGVILVGLLGGGLNASLDNQARLTATLFQPASLPRATDTWPACGRLTPYTDGCVYDVRSGLSWNDVGKVLAIDPTDLKSINKQLSARTLLQRGDELIVWRGVIPLEN